MSELNLLKPTNGSTEVPLLYIGEAQDLTNTVYNVTKESIIRVKAIIDTRLWYYETVKKGTGLLIHAGATVEIPAKKGQKIEIQGSVNLCKYLI